MASAVKSLSVTVNGKEVEVPDGSGISDLLQQLEIQPTLVAIEKNGQIVPKNHFSTEKISPGDQIEIVHFVGGG